MNSGLNNSSVDRREPGLERDPRISALLSTLEPAGDVLGFDNARRIVRSAPPAPVPWYSRLFAGNATSMRLAAAPMLVLLMVGVLWMMPAQSNQVGTIVLTKLPSAWDYGSPEFTEIESYARESYAAQAGPQGELYIKIGTTGGRPQLAFVLMGADESLSREYFNGLKGKFPALGAFDEDYNDIGTSTYDNMLEQLAGTLAGKPGIHDMSDDELRLVALKTMTDAGFDEVEISVTRRDDGSILIEMDAVMRFAVQGHTQDELEAAGFNEQVLGRDLYNQLLGQLETH